MVKFFFVVVVHFSGYFLTFNFVLELGTTHPGVEMGGLTVSSFGLFYTVLFTASSVGSVSFQCFQGCVIWREVWLLLS